MRLNRTSIPCLFITLIIFGTLNYIKVIYILLDSIRQERKIILFGSEWWGDHYPFLSETKWMCPKCIFTEDQRMFSFSDLVIFHGYSLNKEPPVQWRGKNQIWVYLTHEAPDYLGSTVKNTTKYTDMFNWTMTYRHDSEIHVPYGKFVSLKEIPLPKYEETWAFLPSALTSKSRIYDDSLMSIPTLEEINLLWEKYAKTTLPGQPEFIGTWCPVEHHSSRPQGLPRAKYQPYSYSSIRQVPLHPFQNRRMVAWIVSHCETVAKRELVAKELSKYIPIDTYGNCGNFTCDVPKNISHSGIDCHFQISKQYKFYLSFENSLCEDYVTEKYFEILYTQMVPIVYGNANYEKIAPKNSYINVKDFSNMKKLAFYLKYLDSNPQEYLKYFEWRKNYWIQNNRFVTGYCELCKKLWNYDRTIPQFYHNLSEWWYHRSDFKTSGQMACVPPIKFIQENIITK